MSFENIEDIYPLSPMQQGMLFHSIYSPTSGEYVEQMSAPIYGPLNSVAFERAWQKVIERHSILRTAFVWEDLDEPVQVVQKEVAFEVAQYDWCDLSTEQQKVDLAEFEQVQRSQGFDLTEAPLMRLSLFQMKDEHFHFVWTHHHLLLDGWSLPLLFQEVFAWYDAFIHDLDLQLERPRPYRDYIAWLQQQDPVKAEKFWREKLQGFTAPTPLVVDRTRGSLTDAELEYATIQGVIPEETTQALQTLARSHQLTLNTIMQGAWGLLLSIYSNEEDVIFGATVSGRPAELMGAESMLGLFINTLPIRMQVPRDVTFLSWLKDIQQQQAELRQFEYSSLVQIQGWSEVSRDLPLFESILVFENYPIDESLKEEKRTLEIGAVESFTRTNFPITIAASPGKSLGIEILYDSQRFNSLVVKRMLGHLKQILMAFVEAPERTLASISILSPEERQQLVTEWNQSPAGDITYPTELSVNQLFEKQVEKTPNGLAVIIKNKKLSYQELNRRANQLARYLRKLGVGPDSMVGIFVERSLEMIVGIMGILKAGGAYVPLDPAYPEERLAFMLEDTLTTVVLTQEHLVEKLSELTPRIVCLDADWEEFLSEENPQNLKTYTNPENLAYIIYTSGSTGKPKGVMLRQDGLINFITAYANLLNIKPEDRVLQFFSYSFDGSVGDIFVALSSGATLVLVDKENQIPGPGLNQLMREQGVTTAIVPPSVLAVLPSEGLDQLKMLAAGGEAVTRDLVKIWTADNRQFFNVYGPTEATVVISYYLCNHLPENTASVPIGRPLGKAQLYILDDYWNPVPVGVPGELCVGGNILARGYLNRPDLTAEKFIPDPFSTDGGACLYRTGDLVRYLADGNIEFLGRIDYQVKVRGFRIELGEIEEELNQHPDIQRTVVLAREDRPGEKRLVAYWVAAENAEEIPAPKDLQDFLKSKLPEYMVPSVFVQLETFPLTPNGKVNRKALPIPEIERVDPEKAYLAPRNTIEELLAGLWAQVLGVEQVGIQDNFFDLGGHSLTGVKLQSRIKDAFQVDLPLGELFEAPTIAALAELIESKKASEEGLQAPPITAVPRDSDIPLSYSQQRLWFLDQLEPNSPFYNIPTALRFQGNLNISVLEQSLNTVLERHETLRTTFESVDGKPFQRIAERLDLPINKIDLTALSAVEREQEVRRLATSEAQRPFDLSEGPLFRVTVIHLADQEHIILFTMHHIISDGWSVTVLVQEVATLYSTMVAGEPSPLPELAIQYADYAHWQRNWLQGPVMEKLLSYWKEQLAGTPPVLELPTDRSRPAVQSFKGATLQRLFPASLVENIRKLSREEGTTLFMTLLAAFQTLLYRYSGQDDICVGTPIANRNQLETENLIGFFVNTLVLRTDLSDEPTFLELLRRVREVALGAYAHQELPFENLVEALQPQRDLSHTPLFQVMFVLQNAQITSFNLPGLAISSLETDSGNAKFDLTLDITELPEGMHVAFEYNTDLFHQSTIERMLTHFQTLLESIVAAPEQSIALLPIIPETELSKMLIEWNQTWAEFPQDCCMHEWFESLAMKNPEAVAVTFQDQQLTYAELNQRANQLARYLQKQNLRCENLVGICMERSIEMVVSILGTLKAGGAFIPLDPAYPAERLAYMITDARISVLLTQQNLSDQFTSYATKIVAVDAEWSKIAQEAAENLNLTLEPTNLAYIIYTSGSTGKPKGTMLQHRGWCNLARAQQKAFGVGTGSRILQFSSLSFDASVWEFVMALLSGASLGLTARENLTTGQGLLKVFKEDRITTVTLPPSVLAVVPEIELPDLSTIITAGEACTADLVARWSEGRRFFNAYGPTETTVCASMFLVTDNGYQNPPIGRPIANFQLYILDKNLQPVPVGVAGELHVGGVALARGYLNRPELTAEKFIPDPFSREPGSRLYKTGDLTRFLPDGNIEFMGRIDHQVKIRGFRIELGEIEAVLGEHPQLLDVVVIVREDKKEDKRLVAYFVAEPDSDLKVGELRRFLHERLPEYMIPSVFMQLDQIPLTPNGKVNRKALPKPDQSRPELESAYVAPRNESEAKLAQICANLLNVEKVGIYDNFFELGGHSLLATQFLSRLRNSFQIELPLRSLFEKPMIAELAEEIDRLKSVGERLQTAPAIKRVSRDARRVKRSTLVN